MFIDIYNLHTINSLNIRTVEVSDSWILHMSLFLFESKYYIFIAIKFIENFQESFFI